MGPARLRGSSTGATAEECGVVRGEETWRYAQGHYLLGRLHSLAYATEEASASEDIRVLRGSEKPGEIPKLTYFNPLAGSPARPSHPTAAQLGHLRLTLREYREAVRLSPSTGIFHMGLGWALEAEIPDAAKVEGRRSEVVAKEALKEYQTTIRMQLSSDKGMRIEGPVPFYSVEAAGGALRVMRAVPALSSRADIAYFNEVIRQVRNVPRAITPIVISLAGEATLDELLEPGKTADFDLAGDGSQARWPWVRPSTGILVWDPAGKGEINSGRQLFGSATWWMLFPDGYAALSALDGDLDGWLSGRELRGIRVWTDLDGDGKSRPSEVRDLAELGIRSLRARSDGRGATGLFAGTGLKWSDGHTSSSWDWCPSEVLKSPGRRTSEPKRD